jgi:hypothetical protein
MIEISMAHNKPFMVEDQPMIEAIQKAGFDIAWDFTWVVIAKTDEDVEKVKNIFESFPIHKEKSFIVN